MKWYGMSVDNSKWMRNYKYKHNLKVRTLSMLLKPKNRLNIYNLTIYLPPKWKLLAVKSSRRSDSYVTFFLYSPIYFFNLAAPVNHVRVKFDKIIKAVNLKFYYTTNFYSLYWVLFRNIFYSFVQVFFKKIKFKGKGYYIYKNYRNTVAMQFGYSHRLRVYSYFLSIQFITKTALLLFGINKNDILKASFQIFYKRPINVFTGKGIRFNRQIVYKKIGKVSSYR